METIKGTNPLDSLRWQTEQTKVADGRNGMLTQEDFFALLTKELANQDPTKPVDNNEMISQMTAFSTTDGIANLNEQFKTFASSMSSSQALQASSLVGKSVLVDDNRFSFTTGDTPRGKVVTDQPASNAIIYVENEAGEIVQTVPVGNIPEGEFSFTWDGKNSKGEMATDGVYRFRIGGLVDGQASELQAMTYRKVDSVTLAGASGQILLNLSGGTSMALSDIVEVAQG
jgi:flagellar basal-body rod modification protein FlgD